MPMTANLACAASEDSKLIDLSQVHFKASLWCLLYDGTSTMIRQYGLTVKL